MNTISSIFSWFMAARPKKTAEEFTTQVGVHFEEVGEMIDEISPLDQETNNLLLDTRIALTKLADHLKRSETALIEILPENRIKFLDACCDQIVTVTGSAYGQNMQIDGALKAVDVSNWSKFEDGKPIFLPGGKIGKGKDYAKVDLAPFV